MCDVSIGPWCACRYCRNYLGLAATASSALYQLLLLLLLLVCELTLSVLEISTS